MMKTVLNQYNNKIALNVNDRAQTIQGVHIADTNLFQRAKFVLQTMAQEMGISPSASYVKLFIYRDSHPSKIIKDSMAQLDKDMAHDAMY